MKTLYYNGCIHPMTDERSQYSCMLVSRGRIDYVGDNPPAGRYRRIDLEGRHVYPAMTDCHLHLLYSLVLAAGSFQVCSVTEGGVYPNSLEAVGKRISDYCQSRPEAGIITGNGYIVSAIEEKRLPTRQELDGWSGGRAVIIYSIDGHSSAMSTALMERLGIATEGHSGIFSGEEHEFMQGKVTGLIASGVNPAMLARGIANFSNTCARYGIARVCAMDGNEDVKNDILTSLLIFIAGRMDIGVRLFPQYINVERAGKLRRHLRHPRVGGCGAWELDGSVGSRSAAFPVPYKDGSQGHCYYSDETVRAKLRQALESGMQPSAHAIGETAIDQLCNAYAENERLIPSGGAMPRIDHFEFPSEKAIETVKRLRLALTVQPGFSWVDKRYLKSYEHFLPESIIKRQLPLRELADSGVCLCGSSDSPVQSVSPFEQMLGMVDFYLPQQSLTNYQALKSYTVNPALMLGEERRFGTLEKGKSADFFVSAEDILSCPAERLPGIRSELTVINGKPYREKSGSLTELIAMLLRIPHKI